jgi:hypothetical protein
MRETAEGGDAHPLYTIRIVRNANLPFGGEIVENIFVQRSPLEGIHFGLCSAPAQRSGEGALACGTLVSASQSGVALRLPPQSKYSAPVVAAGYPANSSVSMALFVQGGPIAGLAINEIDWVGTCKEANAG